MFLLTEPFRRVKEILWDIAAFWCVPYLYQIMPLGLNTSPAIWQSLLNAILDCLQSREYCKAIVDDLVLLTRDRKSH